MKASVASDIRTQEGCRRGDVLSISPLLVEKYLTAAETIVESAIWAEDPYKLGIPDHFQNAKFITVENAGHWVHHDQIDLVLDLARDFLAD